MLALPKLTAAIVYEFNIDWMGQRKRDFYPGFIVSLRAFVDTLSKKFGFLVQSGVMKIDFLNVDVLFRRHLWQKSGLVAKVASSALTKVQDWDLSAQFYEIGFNDFVRGRTY